MLVVVEQVQKFSCRPVCANRWEKGSNLLLEQYDKRYCSEVYRLVHQRAEQRHVEHPGNEYPHYYEYYNADEYVSRARFFHQAVDVVQQQGYKQYVDCVFYREGEHVANVFSSFYVFVRLRRAYGYCAQGSPYILRTISTASRQAFTS